MTDPAVPRRLLGLPVAEFAYPGELRDRLVALVLAGDKVATAGLLAWYEADGEAVAVPGDRYVVVDSDDRPVGIIETTAATVVPMAEVDDAFAIAEGEGFADAADWRRAHERFWREHLDELRTALVDPGWDLDDETMVVCERFRLESRLDPATGAPVPTAVESDD